MSSICFVYFAWEYYKFSDQLAVGLIAKLVEHRTGIAVIIKK